MLHFIKRTSYPIIIVITYTGDKQTLNLNKFRSFNYKLARMLGDVNAIQKGRIGKRIGRRIVGNFFARILVRLLK